LLTVFALHPALPDSETGRYARDYYTTAAPPGEQPRVFRTGFLSASTLLLGFPARRRKLPAVCNIRVLSEFS
jgi:hypothetical protein